MSKKKRPKIEITELFMAKADWNRTFIGTIRREKDASGKEILHGKVTVVEGQMLCTAISKDELGDKLDTLCVLKLDYGLHTSPMIAFEILGSKTSLN